MACSARRASTSSPALHGVMVLKPFAIPMIGFSKSWSRNPTARSMARFGARWSPAVTARLFRFNGMSLGMGEKHPARSPQEQGDRAVGRGGTRSAPGADFLQRLPLHLVRRHRREGGVVPLARPDPDHLLDGLYE